MPAQLNWLVASTYWAPRHWPNRVSKATDPRTIVDLHDGQSKTAGHLSGNRDEFDLEYYRRTRAIDPPVDYMSMRHIVPEHDSLEEILIDRSITVLQRVRAKHKKMINFLQKINLIKIVKLFFLKEVVRK